MATETLARTQSFSTQLQIPPPVGTRAPKAPDAAAPEDAFCDRPEVVGFAQKRRKWLPFTKTTAVTHPTATSAAGDKNVIIIDLDELGATGSSQNGTAAGATVGMHIFLSGLTVLAFYGTYASVEAIIDATEKLGELKKQRDILADLSERNAASDISPAGKAERERAIQRALRDVKEQRARAHVQRTFMGGFGGTGATLVGTSILANAKMLGAFAPTTLATAATPLMMAAAPVVTVFGTGIAAYEGYKIGRTVQVSRKMKKALTDEGNQPQAAALLRKRLRNLRIVGVVKGASYVGLAVGVPMAVFGGPYGLPVMVISAAGMVSAGVLEGVLTGYEPQMSLLERLALEDRAAISDAVAGVHRRYELLRALRHEKILRYPHGGTGLLPIKVTTHAIAAARRKVGHKARTYASAQEHMLRCVQSFAQLAVEEARDAVNTAALRRDRATEPERVPELTLAHAAARAGLRQAQREERLLDEELQGKIAPATGAFTLMRFLVQQGAMRAFGVELLRHKDLRQAFANHGVVTKDGDEWHFDANALVMYLAQEQDGDDDDLDPDAAAIVEHTFSVAERVLLTAEAKRTLWRERELLDLLADDIRHK